MSKQPTRAIVPANQTLPSKAKSTKPKKKRRTIPFDAARHAGKKVNVYYNLHTHLWSVRDHKTGRVLGHTAQINLVQCTFVVQKGGRERVLREKCKNVHAFVRGYIPMDQGLSFPSCQYRVGYNPYKASTFTKSDDYSAVFSSAFVKMNADRSVWASL